MAAGRLFAAPENELKTIATDTGRTKSYYIVDALTQYFENMQNKFTLENAAKEFSVCSESKTFTAEQVAGEMGIKMDIGHSSEICRK